MAPEVYRRETYGKGVDIFSFALIVYEVIQIPSFILVLCYSPLEPFTGN